MTPEPGREALAAIVAGLEGVTPGPWKKIGSIGEYWLATDDGYLQTGHESAFDEKDADHIARCHPEAIRSIADYVAKVEARATTAEARAEAAEERVAVLEEALKPFADLADEIPVENFWPSSDMASINRAKTVYGQKQSSVRADVLTDLETSIRNSGFKARDELLERLADDGAVDNDLADYLTRIVDACIRAALKRETQNAGQ